MMGLVVLALLGVLNLFSENTGILRENTSSALSLSYK